MAATAPVAGDAARPAPTNRSAPTRAAAPTYGWRCGPRCAQLPPAQRTVVVLRYYEDLTETQVAELLGCSVGTVRSRTHRAVARLRELLPDIELLEVRR